MRSNALALLACFALVACASTAVREPPAELVDFQADYRVKEAWSADVGASAAKSYLRLVPKFSDGMVYAADPEGRVSAFEADSGKRKWVARLATSIGGAVGFGEQLVLIGTRSGQVIALARDTGERVWSASVSSEILAPPVAGDGVVIVQCVDGRLFGLAAADGKRLWVYERSEPALSLRGTDTPTMAADAVVAGFASGKLVALRLKDGGPLWEATVSQPRGRNEIERLVDVDVPPLVFGDAVYAASYQGKLVALNPGTGAVLWSRDVSTYSGLTSDGINLYLTDDKSNVLAFDRRTGGSLWKQEGLRGRRLNAPAIYGDAVVVGDAEGYVHWLGRGDGRFLARYSLGGGPIRSPAVVGGDTLFVSNASGTLAALQLTRK